MRHATRGAGFGRLGGRRRDGHAVGPLDRDDHRVGRRRTAIVCDFERDCVRPDGEPDAGCRTNSDRGAFFLPGVGRDGSVMNGPTEVPGGDWIVNAMDPQGAAFSLHEKKAS